MNDPLGAEGLTACDSCEVLVKIGCQGVRFQNHLGDKPLYKPRLS